MSIKEERKIKKTAWLLLGITILLINLMVSFSKNIFNYRKIPSLTYAKKNIAVRGSIITNDKISSSKGFTIAKSSQVYKAIIDTRYLDSDKKELFVKLFSIYSNIPSVEIEQKLSEQKRLGKVVLSYNIDSRTASNLKQLASLFYSFFDKQNNLRVKFYKPLHKNSSHIEGLDIVISGDKREYPYKKSLTPLIGFISKYEDNKITRMHGVKGLEKYYDKYLNDYQDGLLKGERDVVRNIIFNKDSTIKSTSNGNSLKLNIPLKLQSHIELLAENYKKTFEAKEIIISVMDSTNGKILTFSTSNRYDPKDIKQHQVSYLDVKAVESPFEPGSIIKPITMALVFDKNRVNKGELINAFNKGKRNKKGLYPRGKYKIIRHTIGDDHRFKKRYITPTDTIVYSSNIGILQLAQRLKAQEFIDGFKSFGISKRTGIDLPYEKKGVIHSLKQYQAYETKGKDNIYKATDSYGQGITSTFIQVLKAYSVFNNDGKIVTPQIVNSIVDSNNENIIKEIKTKSSVQVIKPSTAKIIKKMLIKTVKIGTGKGTDIEGLEIGGKTGTSQIARGGKYRRRYISSFFGFANDKDSKYTIGVTVFEPSWKYHYASQSAVVVFREVIDTLTLQGYLKINK